MIQFIKEEARSLIIYIVILLVFVSLENARIAKLKTEINTVVREQCQTGNNEKVLGKYNDFVQAAVDQQTTAQKFNMQSHDRIKAAVNVAFAKRFKADLIPVTKPNCAKPLLR